MIPNLHIRQLGLVPYESTWHDMQAFTENRDINTPDEIWLLEHPPVFTQGQAGKPEHLLSTGDIPVVKVDRGGQVTYHGPGQLVAYVLIDIKRAKIGVRQLVTAIEQAIVDTLAVYQVTAAAKPDAPGVYVADKKIASLGLRIKKGRSFHGLALNVDMSLEPFLRINPCGYAGLAMVQLKDFVVSPDMTLVKQQLASALAKQLGAVGVTHIAPSEEQ